MSEPKDPPEPNGDPSPDWDADERVWLDAWNVAPAPTGFADDVLTAVAALPAQPSQAAVSTPSAANRIPATRAPAVKAPSSARRRLAMVAAIAATVVAVQGLQGVGHHLAWPGSDRLHAAGRTTIAVGPHALAVAEDGAELAWDVALSGQVRVEQNVGEVFYRVEPGSDFVVQTAAGSVAVVGTCLRIDVQTTGAGKAAAGRETKDAMNQKSAGAVGTLAGAVAASLVWVTVYEGEVRAENGGAGLQIGAGESARLTPGRAPMAVSPGQVAARKDGPWLASLGAAGSTSAAEPMPSGLSNDPAMLRSEVARLQNQERALRERVALLDSQAQRVRTYDLGPEKLERMAKLCELRWDMPGIALDRPPTLAGEDAHKAGVSDAERAELDAALVRYNDDMLAELRRLYSEVTGEHEVEAISPEALMAEINDKTVQSEVRAAFQRLAEERAGLRSPPAAGEKLSAIERLYRKLTGAGDRVESDFAQVLGPERAHALRDGKQGFGSRHRSSFGCPGDEE